MPTGMIGEMLNRAFSEGLLRLDGEGKTERIIYVKSGANERWSDPEEKVRAEFYAELIYKYEYAPEKISIEAVVPRRTPNDRADIVVYSDTEKKQPYIVIECKRDGISDSEFQQAIEQACGNRASLSAPYTGVVAGGTQRFFDFTASKPLERFDNIIADLPINYGSPPEYRFYRDLHGKDISAVPREQLRLVIRKCHQSLWEGGRRSAISAFGEFSKIIFVKIKDEINNRRKSGEPYEFQRRTGESNEDLANRIQYLYETERKREPDVFTERLNIDPPILAQVVEHLESVSLHKTDLDTKGVAFEEFMGGFFKGDFGQYFTPRDLVSFAVQMIPPSFDDIVLDPACGSGGFLLYSLDFIRGLADEIHPNYKTDPISAKRHYELWHDFASSNLFGLEINEELSRVAKMNMIIHDDGHTNVVGHDALDHIDNIKRKNSKFDSGFATRIYTNPPFGSVIKSSEKGAPYLEQYSLRNYITKGRLNDTDSDGDTKKGLKSAKSRSSVKTEILFLERIFDFLKEGGKTAIILPDGILTNASLRGVREWILEHFKIIAVVSLPQFAFQHYDAGVKSSMLFLEKRSSGRSSKNFQGSSELIFMATANNIGYDAAGRKTFIVEVASEAKQGERIEIQKCDLFDYRVTYELSTTSDGKQVWNEKNREVIKNTGIVAEFIKFTKNPEDFFA